MERQGAVRQPQRRLCSGEPRASSQEAAAMVCTRLRANTLATVGACTSRSACLREHDLLDVELLCHRPLLLALVHPGQRRALARVSAAWRRAQAQTPRGYYQKLCDRFPGQ
eukprot:3097209-Pleurochrysis_carterae.AAC.2